MAEQYPVENEPSAPLFVTGLYGDKNGSPCINVYSKSSALLKKPVWSWSPVTDDTLTGAQWKDLRQSQSITEVKWADGGKKVVGLLGDYIILVSVPKDNQHKPHLVFATKMCDAPGAHSVEVIPDNRIAVADTGKTVGNAGVQVYAIGSQRLGTGNYEQQVTGFPATHGLLWDQTKKWLWVVGANKWPTTEGAQGLLRAYAYDASTRLLNPQPATKDKKVGTGNRTKEAHNEWDSPHDVVGVPGTRKLLITTEEDVYVWDIDKPEQDPVSAPQLKDFTSHSTERNDNGRPRSRFKSIGIRAGTGEIIYTQPSKWGSGNDYPDMIGFYKNPSSNDVVRLDQTTYKARWFEATPHWESPLIQEPRW
ncbi:MAG: hypothetical protein ACRDRW_10010 [Pseudonocardiaceae bacterium]